MPFDVDAALASLRSVNAPRGNPSFVPARPPWPAGAPARDYERSPAAMRVGHLAADVGLSLFHFEHRTTLELPEAWVAPGRADDARPPEWSEGQLPESKYQSFRHDLYLGSFHPGHRAKWTTHELCHALVGTAWRPDATPFFHATAARLAELLPVTLWYWLDEVDLRRCPDHAGEGAMFRSYCQACQDAAALGPERSDDASARRFLQQGQAFLDGELAAVARSLRAGRPIPHRWATLDLSTDGLAYAAAHAGRLSSAVFARFAETFGVGFRSLEELEARVVEVARAIVEGAPLSPASGRWVEQDVAWRLLQVAEDTDGEVRSELDALVDGLAADRAIADVVAAYGALHEEWVLPDPELVFAVGYDLPGVPALGRSVAQVREGLKTVTPLTLELLDDAGAGWLERFVAADAPERRPLGDRFAAWLEAALPGPIADLARYESALRHSGGDAVAGSLGREGAFGPWKLANGARAWVAARDVTQLAEAVDNGDVSARVDGDGLALDGPVPQADPTGIVVGRDGAGEVVVVEVPPEVAEALCTGRDPAVNGDERAVLVDVGLLIPTAWAQTRG